MKKKNINQTAIADIDRFTQDKMGNIKGGAAKKVSWGTSVTVAQKPVSVTATISG